RLRTRPDLLSCPTRRSSDLMLADGVFIRPVAASEGIADEGNLGPPDLIRFDEIAPADHRNVHCVQITRAGHTHVHLRLLGHGENGATLDGKRLVRAAAAERQGVDGAGGPYSRQRAHSMQNLMEKIDLTRGTR